MYTSGNGMMSGLLVVADTMIQVKQYSTLYALGFKVRCLAKLQYKPQCDLML